MADDDPGPLAVQEILLAGCPIVGVRTGAPFVQDGITGAIVQRLPPGKKCVTNDNDFGRIQDFDGCVHRALAMDRSSRRSFAVESFKTEKIVDRLSSMLEVAAIPDEAKSGVEEFLGIRFEPTASILLPTCFDRSR